MPIPELYQRSQLATHFSARDVLAGEVVRINPALITITDGLVHQVSTAQLQQRVRQHVAELLEESIQTFHIDINFGDYGGFGPHAPDMNGHVFSPEFVTQLAHLTACRNAYINLHLLTDQLCDRLRAYVDCGAGAICFQLDAIHNSDHLRCVLDQIHTMNAASSPVIETIGTPARPAIPPQAVHDLLCPHIDAVDMLTIQAATTAARSNQRGVCLDTDAVTAYLSPLKSRFSGPLQIQGGITIATIPQAVELGAEFLVAGTQIFRNSSGQSPAEVIHAMHRAAADTLAP